ncbi:MAG: hypothetical protein JXP34_10985 [Planctomycetes bacterium]|nr:hypothetical protein [Planctomycetota bacterium]
MMPYGPIRNSQAVLVLVAAFAPASVSAAASPDEAAERLRGDPKAQQAFLDEFLEKAVAVEPPPRRSERRVWWVDGEARLKGIGWAVSGPPLNAPRGTSRRGSVYACSPGALAQGSLPRLREIIEVMARAGARGLTSPRFPGWDFSFVPTNTEIQVHPWEMPREIEVHDDGIPYAVLAQLAVPQEPGWGEPRRYGQARIRSDQEKWPAGRPPILFLDVRNLSDKALAIINHGEGCTLFIDGRPYRWRKPDPEFILLGRFATKTIAPEAIHPWIPIVPDAEWTAIEEGDKAGPPLSLGPGTHTFRAVVGFFEAPPKSLDRTEPAEKKSPPDKTDSPPGGKRHRPITRVLPDVIEPTVRIRDADVTSNTLTIEVQA